MDAARARRAASSVFVAHRGPRYRARSAARSALTHEATWTPFFCRADRHLVLRQIGQERAPLPPRRRIIPRVAAVRGPYAELHAREKRARIIGVHAAEVQ